MKQYAIPVLMWLLFEAIGVALWLTLGNSFYLFNFSYIGTSLALGIFLYIKKVKYARNVVQFAVGFYMLVYLGILSRENMQIEGFWYYLFSGVFGGAVIHYAAAKILGPFLFGRGWCGYACWTAAVLDLLPFPIPRQPRKKRSFIRYALFAGSLLFVAALFFSPAPSMDMIMFRSFMIGNALYYAAGIALAFALKDNRAFCKYVCPVVVFLKPASYYALLRVKNDETKCISCGRCRKVCPMDVDVPDNSRRRFNGTECILCLKCIAECPAKALHL
ncbi:MAG TPA: 4Fe-4S dicluster domain-containing protein [Bacillota bacterium]|nr:4Fe-4S dicluster domain-containing protein [Bacillota bacterium]